MNDFNGDNIKDIPVNVLLGQDEPVEDITPETDILNTPVNQLLGNETMFQDDNETQPQDNNTTLTPGSDILNTPVNQLLGNETQPQVVKKDEEPPPWYGRIMYDIGAGLDLFGADILSMVPFAGGLREKLLERYRHSVERADVGLDELGKFGNKVLRTTVWALPSIYTLRTFGGATRGLVSRVAPRAAAALSTIGDFAVGSFEKGFAEGVREDGSVLHRTLSGLKEGTKEAVLGKAYEALPGMAASKVSGKLSKGLAQSGTMVGLAAADTTVQTLEEEGRLPTKQEMTEAVATGFAMDVAFRAVHAASKASHSLIEKRALQKGTEKFAKAKESGDSEKILKAYDDVLKDPKVREPVKEVIKEAAENTYKEAKAKGDKIVPDDEYDAITKNKGEEFKNAADRLNEYLTVDSAKHGKVQVSPEEHTRIRGAYETGGEEAVETEIDKILSERPKEPSKFSKAKDAVKKTVGEIKEEIGGAVSPEAGSESAKDVDAYAAYLIREHTHNMNMYNKRLEESRKTWRDVPEDVRIKFLEAAEEKTPGGKRQVLNEAAAGDQRVAQTLYEKLNEYSRHYDDIHRAETGHGVKVGFIKDYVPHIFTEGERAQKVYRKIRAKMGVDRFAKLRTIDKIKAGLDAGLTLSSTNPDTILLKRLDAAGNSIKAMKMFRYLEDKGIAKEAYPSKKKLVQMLKDKGIEVPREAVPKTREELVMEMRDPSLMDASMQEVRAKAAERGIAEDKLVYPSTDKLRRFATKIGAYDTTAGVKIDDPNGKTYIVPKKVYKVLKNAGFVQGHNPSLWHEQSHLGKAFRGYMRLKNVTLGSKLGLSGYHWMHVASIDAANKIAEQMEHHLKSGTKKGSLTTEQLKLAERYKKGSKIQELWDKDVLSLDKVDREKLKWFEEGGMNPKQDEVWKVAAKERFSRAVKNKEVAKAMPLGAAASSEWVQHWLFEKFVPNLKNAAYLDRVETLLERKPELKKPENADARRRAFREIAKEIDNRYGEMAYDTLFWNRYLKDVGIASTLSMGWNLGFIREYGGAIKDTGKFLKKALKGKASREDITSKMMFVSTYTVQSMIIGGLITYLFTGEMPKQLIDFIFPKTGKKDRDGNDLRFNTPFYTRELYSIGHHILHEGPLDGLVSIAKNKAAPVLPPFIRILRNRDYFGNEIVDPHSSAYQQAKDGLKYLGTELFMPISFTSGSRANEVMGLKGVGMAALGFGQAPSYAVRPGVQLKILDEYRKRRSFTSKYDSDKISARRKLRIQLINNGHMDEDDLKEAIKKGYFGRGYNTVRRNIRRFVAGARTSSIYTIFKHLPSMTQVNLLKEMNEEELREYLPHASKRAKLEFARSRR